MPSVTDARGITGSASVKPIVYDWFIPKIGTFRAERCNSSGKMDEVGNYIRLDYSVEVEPVNNKNFKSLKYGYKKQSDTSWTVKDIALSSYSKTGNVVIPASGEYSWNVKVDLKDDFTTATLSLQVGTAYVLMDFHKSGKGLSIGKIAEKERLLDIEKGWTVNCKVFSIGDFIQEQGVSGGWVWRKWYSEVAEYFGVTRINGSSTSDSKFVKVTLPFSFINTSYSVQATPTLNANILLRYWVANSGGNMSRTKNSFEIHGRSTSANGYGIEFDLHIIEKWK